MAKSSALFARLALDYADHPKIIALSDAAFRAHITFILYCRKYETDGIIKNRVANRLALQWDTEVLTELQSNDDQSPSVVQMESGDYYLSGYEEMQETKAEISARRQRNADNGKKGGRPRKPKQTQSKTHSVSESGTESKTESGTQKKAETETETELIPKGINVSDSSNEEIRPDVEAVLDRIDQHCADHDFKKPSRTKQTLNAARLMIDKDERTLEQINWIMEWVTAHSFWASNIMSASKLREKFDQLKGQALSNRGSGQQYITASQRRLQEGHEREQRIMAGELSFDNSDNPYLQPRPQRQAIEGGSTWTNEQQ